VIVGVADTHPALWYLFKNPLNPLLSATARSFIDDAAAAGNDIVLSPISMAEIVYLTEKNRLPTSAYEKLSRKQFENAADGDPHPLDARLSAALSRLNRDPIKQVYRRHVPSLDRAPPRVAGIEVALPSGR
jgi:PIN domain nuclease of toxin-antitoxin system